MLASGATGNQLQDNIIRDNIDYGVSMKSADNILITGNQITGNTIGVYLGAEQPVEILRQRNQIAGNREGDVRIGSE